MYRYLSKVISQNNSTLQNALYNLQVDTILEFSSNQQTKYYALQILESVIKTRWKVSFVVVMLLTIFSCCLKRDSHKNDFIQFFVINNVFFLFKIYFCTFDKGLRYTLCLCIPVGLGLGDAALFVDFTKERLHSLHTLGYR
jgi:hypothetical protein